MTLVMKLVPNDIAYLYVLDIHIQKKATEPITASQIPEIHIFHVLITIEVPYRKSRELCELFSMKT